MVRNLVESVFGITVTVVLLTEPFNIFKPDKPVFLEDLVERLCCQCILKELNPYLFYASVFYDRLEILVR